MGKQNSKLQCDINENLQKLDIFCNTLLEEYEILETQDFSELSPKSSSHKKGVSVPTTEYQTLKSLFTKHWAKTHPSGEFNPNPVAQKPGTTYTGEWLQGQKNGYGIFQFNRTEIIEGYWSENKLLGKVLVSKDNFYYFGELLNGKGHGPGIKYHYGIRSEGNFINGVIQGYAEETWPNGTIYKGDYKNGTKHGIGKFEGPDKSFYEGEMENGEICGKGRFWTQNNKEYCGEWKENKPDGQGVFKYGDGSKYCGGFVKGKKCGFGELELKSGRKLKGEFKDNFIDGWGTCWYEDGFIYEGMWMKGKKHGKGSVWKVGTERVEAVWEQGVLVKNSMKKNKCKISNC